jgi:polysaccharide export outer membrane protein
MARGIEMIGANYMYRWFWICAVALALVLGALGGCSTRNGTSVGDAESLQVPDRTAATSLGDFRIAPLDVLDISVFGVDDLNGSYQVDPEGKIRLPLVGIIDAKGYSVFEFAAELERVLGERYLRDPQVTVRVSTATRQIVTVEGAVARPGLFPVQGPLTLLQAVAQAGGTTTEADASNVIVFRTIEGERRAARFNLNRIRNGRDADPAIFGNDIVVVFGSNTRRSYTELLRALPIIGLFSAF